MGTFYYFFSQCEDNDGDTLNNIADNNDEDGPLGDIDGDGSVNNNDNDDDINNCLVDRAGWIRGIPTL